MKKYEYWIDLGVKYVRLFVLRLCYFHKLTRRWRLERLCFRSRIHRPSQFQLPWGSLYQRENPRSSKLLRQNHFFEQSLTFLTKKTKVFRKVFGKFLESFWKVFGKFLESFWKSRFRCLSYCCSVHKYIWSRSKNIPVNMLHFYRTIFVILQV